MVYENGVVIIRKIFGIRYKRISTDFILRRKSHWNKILKLLNFSGRNTDVGIIRGFREWYCREVVVFHANFRKRTYISGSRRRFLKTLKNLRYITAFDNRVRNHFLFKTSGETMSHRFPFAFLRQSTSQSQKFRLEEKCPKYLEWLSGDLETSCKNTTGQK